MGMEHEIMVLGVDRKEVVSRLGELGARREGSYRFRRVEFFMGGNIGGGHSWGRVRTDGRRTTITLKEMDARDRMAPMVEHEIEASDFRAAATIMARLAGSGRVFYFENSREAYRLGKAYVTIDKWPGIPAFVEIEAPSMQAAVRLHRRLGIRGEFVGNATIKSVYERYGLSFEKVVSKNAAKAKSIVGGSG